MQVSKDKVNKKVKQDINEQFWQTIADLKTKKNAEVFLTDFLTKTEHTVLTKRLAIAVYLERGSSYEEIKEDLKVSSATIASLDKMMHQHSSGFTLALKRIEAEAWATKLAKKITKFLKNLK